MLVIIPCRTEAWINRQNFRLSARQCVLNGAVYDLRTDVARKNASPCCQEASSRHTLADWPGQSIHQPHATVVIIRLLVSATHTCIQEFHFFSLSFHCKALSAPPQVCSHLNSCCLHGTKRFAHCFHVIVASLPHISHSVCWMHSSPLCWEARVPSLVPLDVARRLSVKPSPR